MVKMIEVSSDQIEVGAGEVKVHADIGTGRVVHATLVIEENAPAAESNDPAKMSFEEWEKNLTR